MNNYYFPSTWRRLLARSIDQLLSSLMYLPFVVIFFKMFFSNEPVLVTLPELIILFLIPAIYEFIFLFLFQSTPGKWFLGLKVVPFSDSNGQLEVLQCILRPLVGRFSFFFSWAIYALAFFRYDRTHLADWVAGTRVVQSEPRLVKPRVRPFLGILFVVFYSIEGLHSARGVLQKIDWRGGQTNLQELIELDSIEDILREAGAEADL